MGKKSSKKGSPWTVVITAIITFIAGIILMHVFRDAVFPPSVPQKPGPETPVTPPSETPLPVPQKPAAAETISIDLYFSAPSGKNLKAEHASVKKGALADEIKAAVELLINGPSEKGLTTVLPTGTRLRSVRVDKGIAYVDFSREIIKKHPGGSSAEIQTIYSIVNTVCLNFKEVRQVQILVEGEKEDSIAGHIFIQAPLAPDKQYIGG